MGKKWLKRCFLAYLAGMALCGAARGAENPWRGEDLQHVWLVSVNNSYTNLSSWNYASKNPLEVTHGDIGGNDGKILMYNFRDIRGDDMEYPDGPQNPTGAHTARLNFVNPAGRNSYIQAIIAGVSIDPETYQWTRNLSAAEAAKIPTTASGYLTPSNVNITGNMSSVKIVWIEATGDVVTDLRLDKALWGWFTINTPGAINVTTIAPYMSYGAYSDFTAGTTMNLRFNGDFMNGIIATSGGTSTVTVNGNVNGSTIVRTSSTGTSPDATVTVTGNTDGLQITNTGDIGVVDWNKVTASIGSSTDNVNIRAYSDVNFTAKGDINNPNGADDGARRKNLTINSTNGQVVARTAGVSGSTTINSGTSTNLTMTGDAGQNVNIQAGTSITANLVNVGTTLTATSSGTGNVTVDVSGSIGDAATVTAITGDSSLRVRGGGVGGNTSVTATDGNASANINGRVNGTLNVDSTNSGNASAYIASGVNGAATVHAKSGSAALTVAAGGVNGAVNVQSEGNGSSTATVIGNAGNITVSANNTVAGQDATLVAKEGTVQDIELNGYNNKLTLGSSAQNINFTKNGAGKVTLEIDGEAGIRGGLTGMNIDNTIFTSGSLTLANGIDLNATTVNGTAALNAGGDVNFTSLTVNNAGNLTMNGNGKTFTVANALTNNGTLNIGNNATLALTTATANQGAINFGNNAKLTHGGDFTNAGTMGFHTPGTATIDLGGNKLTNSGRMNFSNGQLLTINNALSNSGNISINLDRYQKMDAGGTAVITADAYTNSGSMVIGGGLGGDYRIVKTTAAMGADVMSNLTFLPSIMNTYKALLENANMELNVNTTINVQGIIDTATAYKESNRGAAEVIARMALNNTLPLEIHERLNAIYDPVAFGQAISQLNGTDAGVAASQTSMNAVKSFNRTLSQLFAFDHATRIYGDNVYVKEGTRAPRENTKTAVYNHRASAGGVPTDRDIGPDGFYDQDLWSGFFKFYGGWGVNDASNNAGGSSMSTYGLVVGLDRLIAKELAVGMLFGYSNNYSYFDDNNGETSDNTLRLGCYANYNYNNFYFASSFTGGIHIMDTQRHIRLIGQTARGERPAFDLNWFNEVGYTFVLPGWFMLTPSYSLATTFYHDTEYTESETTLAQLHINDYSNWSLCQDVGFKIGRAFTPHPGLCILPEIWAGWEHEYLDRGQMSMNFAKVPGSSWAADVTTTAADRAYFGAGVNTIFSNKYEIDARYDMRLWDGGYDSNISIELGIKF